MQTESKTMLTNAEIVAVGVDAEEYHNNGQLTRGHSDYPMSSGALREFRKCPARWQRGYTPPDSEAKAFGSLLDCLVLTPEQFDSRYAVRPATYKNEKGETKPFNLNANVCKQWVEEQGAVEIITRDELAEVQAARDSLSSDAIIRDFITCSECQVHIKAEWQDKETGLVVPVKALLDLVPHKDSTFAKSFGDLKTTRNASLMAWTRWCYQAGYHQQMAFYGDMLREATGEDRVNACFVLVENYAPWQTAKRFLSEDFLEIGRLEYQSALKLYCACLKAGKWPDYDENDENCAGWSLVSPFPWMANEDAFAPKIITPEAEEPEPEDVVP